MDNGLSREENAFYFHTQQKYFLWIHFLVTLFSRIFDRILKYSEFYIVIFFLENSFRFMTLEHFRKITYFTAFCEKSCIVINLPMFVYCYPSKVYYRIYLYLKELPNSKLIVVLTV